MAITTINNDPDKSKNEMSFEERERELKYFIFTSCDSLNNQNIMITIAAPAYV